MIRTLLVPLTALALFAGACMTSDESSSSRELGADESGTGGDCADILEHGCDGATGEKLAACEAGIQGAYEECVAHQACLDPYLAALDACGKDAECVTAAWEVYAECVGPSPNDQPDK